MKWAFISVSQLSSIALISKRVVLERRMWCIPSVTLQCRDLPLRTLGPSYRRNQCQCMWLAKVVSLVSGWCPCHGWLSQVVRRGGYKISPLTHTLPADGQQMICQVEWTSLNNLTFLWPIDSSMKVKRGSHLYLQWFYGIPLMISFWLSPVLYSPHWCHPSELWICNALPIVVGPGQ